MRKNCKTFEQWMESQYNEFYSIVGKGKSKYLRVSVGKTSSSIAANITNNKTGKFGHASVKAGNFDDPFLIATALAWVHYKGEKIPDFSLRLCNLSTGDIFYHEGRKYRYLTQNPYAKSRIIGCDSEGTPHNFESWLRVNRPR